MSAGCEALCQALAAAGPGMLRHAQDARQHVARCPACFAFLEALQELEAVTQQLPEYTPPGALLERVRRQAAESPETVQQPAAGAPATSACETSKTEDRQQQPPETSKQPGRRFYERVRDLKRWHLALFATAAALVAGVVSLKRDLLPVGLGAHTPAARHAMAPLEHLEQQMPEWLNEGQAGGGRRHRDEGGGVDRRTTGNKFGIEGPGDTESPAMAREEAHEMAAGAGIIGILKAQVGQWGDDSARGSEPMSALGALLSERGGPRFAMGGLGLRAPKDARPAADLQAQRAPPPAPAVVRPDQSAPLQREGMTRAQPRHPAPRRPSANAAGEGLSAPIAPAGLLARYASLDDLRFQPASGYWESNYIPGDRKVRLLEAQLAERAPGILQGMVAGAREPSRQARRYAQPFDASPDAALGVYINASEAGTTAKKRMLVQVGVQGTPRTSGRRPAMNVAWVLDLQRRAADSETKQLHATLGALVEAMEKARDLNDRFSLLVAGRPGGLIVPAREFRHGQLAVMLERLLSGEQLAGQTLTLSQAVELASQTARGSLGPDSPLGSSTVVVVTPNALLHELPQLEERAHLSALAGTPLSVIGVGPGVAADELGKLAMAGQGNRHLLSRAADARGVVERELSTLASVVARAVRIHVRLAPGVQLVDVLGCRPLQEQDAHRVRQVEQNIDQRLSRGLGISLDRGEDDEGIQVVLPSFHAGDAHVILLDVVVDGPGPVADLTVRYKDLVHLRNGLARSSLSLPNRALPRTAIQRAVLKNLLSFEISRELEDASRALARSDRHAAAAHVDAALEKLRSMTTDLPQLTHDGELRRDAAMLAEYRHWLGKLGERPDKQAQYAYLADSLRLSALLKQTAADDPTRGAGQPLPLRR